MRLGSTALATGRVERRLAATLAADVAGYTRLMGTHEEGTLAGLKVIRREVADPKIQEHRGRIVKTTGDGLLVEFTSVVDAVRCAVDVQRKLAERNVDVPPDRRIELRMGINLGDIIKDGRDIYGDGVNIAAGLVALAEPGDICISPVVRDRIRDEFPYIFEDRGEHSIENVARPVGVYAMDATVIASLPPVSTTVHAASTSRGFRAIASAHSRLLVRSRRSQSPLFSQTSSSLLTLLRTFFDSICRMN